MHLHFISVPDMFFLCCISLRFFSANSCACVTANRHGGESFWSLGEKLLSLARSLSLSLHAHGKGGKGRERGEIEKTSATDWRADRKEERKEKEARRERARAREISTYVPSPLLNSGAEGAIDFFLML
jgi:hypothetical protein